MPPTSAVVVLASLLIGLAAGYVTCLFASSRPSVVRTDSPVELQFSPNERCVIPTGTVLEYDRTLGAEAVSTYILYLNIKDGELPEPHKEERRWFRSTVFAYTVAE